jgi:O-antigen/teichoic acid export membrane protein
MIQTTLGSLGVVAGLALGLTVTKSVAEASITGSVRESSEKQLRRNSEILSLLYLISGLSGAAIGIMTYLLAPWLSIYVLKSPDLEYPLRISTVPIFFNALNGIQLGALAGIQAFHLMARLGIASGAISLVCTVTGAHIGGLVGACAGLSISSAINFIVVQATLTAQLQRRGIMLVRSGVWQHRHILTSFSLPAFLAALLVDPVNWLCAAML